MLKGIVKLFSGSKKSELSISLIKEAQNFTREPNWPDAKTDLGLRSAVSPFELFAARNAHSEWLFDSGWPVDVFASLTMSGRNLASGTDDATFMDKPELADERRGVEAVYENQIVELSASILSILQSKGKAAIINDLSTAQLRRVRVLANDELAGQIVVQEALRRVADEMVAAVGPADEYDLNGGAGFIVNWQGVSPGRGINGANIQFAGDDPMRLRTVKEKRWIDPGQTQSPLVLTVVQGCIRSPWGVDKRVEVTSNAKSLLGYIGAKYSYQPVVVEIVPLGLMGKSTEQVVAEVALPDLTSTQQTAMWHEPNFARYRRTLVEQFETNGIEFNRVEARVVEKVVHDYLLRQPGVEQKLKNGEIPKRLWAEIAIAMVKVQTGYDDWSLADNWAFLDKLIKLFDSFEEDGGMAKESFTQFLSSEGQRGLYWRSFSGWSVAWRPIIREYLGEGRQVRCRLNSDAMMVVLAQLSGCGFNLEPGEAEKKGYQLFCSACGNSGTHGAGCGSCGAPDSWGVWQKMKMTG
jgi:hypothetical protein